MDAKELGGEEKDRLLVMFRNIWNYGGGWSVELRAKVTRVLEEASGLRQMHDELRVILFPESLLGPL
jgi:hypothetical protein